MSTDAIRRGVTELKSHPWLTNSQVSDLVAALKTESNPEYSAIFSLLILSGEKYSRLADLPWGNLNLRLGLLRIDDHRTVFIPAELNKTLTILREKATAEEQPLVKTLYRVFWRALEKHCQRLQIQHSGIKTLKLTFAAAHYRKFQSRAKLKKALGITTLRYLPESLFNQQPDCLFQGVL